MNDIIRKYSPKENLALIIKASKFENTKDFLDLVFKLKQLLEENTNSNEILDEINADMLHEVKNYWSLKKSQVLAYGFLVFDFCTSSSDDITPESLTVVYNMYMKLYAPDNAVEYVKRHYNCNLEVEDHE